MTLNALTAFPQAYKPHSYRAIGGAAVLLAIAVGLLFSASSALAAAPWWGLSSESWPTNLHPGVARDEVQELTVSATGGEFFLPTVGAFVKFDVQPERLQEILEGHYGAGNVLVTGGPGDEQGDKPYVVTFTGALADQPVEPIAVVSSFFGVKLTGGRAEASVKEDVQGRADGKIVVTTENLGDAWADGSFTPVVIEDTLPSGSGSRSSPT